MSTIARSNLFRSYASHQGHSSFNIALMATGNYFQVIQSVPNSVDGILAFIIPILVTLLQLKYQGKNTPFETHSVVMYIAIASLLTYGLACVIEHLHHALGPIKRLSGSLSLASLASIFLPDWIRALLYVLCALLSLSQSILFLLQLLKNWIHQRPNQGSLLPL